MSSFSSNTLTVSSSFFFFARNSCRSRKTTTNPFIVDRTQQFHSSGQQLCHFTTAHRVHLVEQVAYVYGFNRVSQVQANRRALEAFLGLSKGVSPATLRMLTQKSQFRCTKTDLLISRGTDISNKTKISQIFKGNIIFILN